MRDGAGNPVRDRSTRGIAFGAISLIAGIVVAATPVTSVTVLAVLLGIWFIVIGFFEIIAGIMPRRAVNTAEATLAGSAAGLG